MVSSTQGMKFQCVWVQYVQYAPTVLQVRNHSCSKKHVIANGTSLPKTTQNPYLWLQIDLWSQHVQKPFTVANFVFTVPTFRATTNPCVIFKIPVPSRGEPWDPLLKYRSRKKGIEGSSGSKEEASPGINKWMKCLALTAAPLHVGKSSEQCQQATRLNLKK